jgi:hypothetical protein
MERRIRPVVAKRAAGHARRGAHHHAVGAANFWIAALTFLVSIASIAIVLLHG